jgi:hypothetical protein
MQNFSVKVYIPAFVCYPERKCNCRVRFRHLSNFNVLGLRHTQVCNQTEKSGVNIRFLLNSDMGLPECDRSLIIFIDLDDFQAKLASRDVRQA